MTSELESAINTNFAHQSVVKYPHAYNLGKFIFTTVSKPNDKMKLTTAVNIKNPHPIVYLKESICSLCLEYLELGAAMYDSNVALYKVEWRVGKVFMNVTLYGNETLKRATGMPFNHESDLGAVKDERRPAA